MKDFFWVKMAKVPKAKMPNVDKNSLFFCEREEGIIMAENLYRKATKEEREAAWAECRMMNLTIAS